MIVGKRKIEVKTTWTCPTCKDVKLAAAIAWCSRCRKFMERYKEPDLGQAEEILEMEAGR